MKRDPIYGIMAEFDSAQALVDAARQPIRPATRRSMPTARSPSKAWPKKSALHHDEVPLVVLIGGIIGGLTGYLMQYWMRRS